MDNTTYERFEAAAKPHIRAYLETLLPELERNGFRVIRDDAGAAVQDIDQDIERGMSLSASYSPHGEDDRVFVDVKVTDGEERGFEEENQAGIFLECVGMGGFVIISHAPYNFQQQVGVSDPAEMPERVKLLPPAAEVASTLKAWTDVHGQTLAAEHPRNG